MSWSSNSLLRIIIRCLKYRLSSLLGLYNHHHHHHIALVARISLTLSRHSSLSFIAIGRSSGQHPVSSHSCWMYVRAGRPAFARPCVGIHKSTSLMSSSLLLQQSPACLVRLERVKTSLSTSGWIWHKLNLIVRLHYWIFREYGILLHYHNSPVHSVTE